MRFDESIYTHMSRYLWKHYVGDGFDGLFGPRPDDYPEFAVIMRSEMSADEKFAAITKTPDILQGMIDRERAAAIELISTGRDATDDLDAYAVALATYDMMCDALLRELYPETFPLEKSQAEREHEDERARWYGVPVETIKSITDAPQAIVRRSSFMTPLTVSSDGKRISSAIGYAAYLDYIGDCDPMCWEVHINDTSGGEYVDDVPKNRIEAERLLIHGLPSTWIPSPWD